MKTIKISNLKEGDLFMYKDVMYEIVHKDKWETHCKYVNCVIVDEEYFNEIKKKAESNQERINEIAEEKVFGICQRKRYRTLL